MTTSTFLIIASLDDPCCDAFQTFVYNTNLTYPNVLKINFLEIERG